MQTDVMFLDCPAYMDGQRAVRCGLPAAVKYWYIVESTSGPLVSTSILRLQGLAPPGQALASFRRHAR